MGGTRLVVPTEAEMLRIKAVLILKRNATRDYLDFVALQQLQSQLVRPLPYDLEGTNLAEYRRLDPRWHDRRRVADACAAIAAGIFDRLWPPRPVAGLQPERPEPDWLAYRPSCSWILGNLSLPFTVV